MERTAVITGASQGLGLALARRLAADGWALAIDARRPDRLTAAADELRDITRVAAIAGDIADPDHRLQLATAARLLGSVRLVVNNASTLGESPLPALDTIDTDVLRRTFDVNVVAPIALVQLLADSLGAGRDDRQHHERRGGRGVPHVGRVRREQGGARARRSGARRRASRVAGAHRRSRRHAHRDAPGRLPRRGHRRPTPNRRRACRGCWR